MPISVFIALRFMWEQRSQNALIIFGVGVGVAVLVFISALIGGLQSSLIERTMSTQAHIVVSAQEREARPVLPEQSGVEYVRRAEKPAQKIEIIDEWQKVDTNVSGLGAVTATAPVASGPAFAVRGNANVALVLFGADPERLDSVIEIKKNIVAGSYSVSGADVVLGVDLADDLGVEVGDRVRLRTPFGEGNTFTVRGLVDMGSVSANRTWALVSLRNAQTLLGIKGTVTALYVQVDELYEAESVAADIERLTRLSALSWMESNAQLLTMLKSQSASTTMIRIFVIITVAIGIASVLVVSVLQRSREIGILRAMGTARAVVLSVFLIQGATVGLLGSVIGCGLGAALAMVFRAIAQNPDGTPFFPFTISVWVFVSAAGVATLAGVIAALLPARRAAALEPAVAIRG